MDEHAGKKGTGKGEPAYDRIYNRYIKRVLDIVISGTALLFLWPLLLVISVAVAAETGFPVFYRAPRGGYRGRTFQICKFRTMVKDADRIGGGTTALHDSRITHIGGFLRKTKMDELPQLVQVFTGRMSLIGPRPELLQYVEEYTGDERCILEVRPGITDYASVALIDLDEIVGEEDADRVYEERVLKKKNALRMEYAQDVSFRTDAVILIRTVCAVFRKMYAYLILKKHR